MINHEEWKKQLHDRLHLVQALQVASDAVHAITGNTNQTVHDICSLYPDRVEVKAFRAAQHNLDEFDVKE